MLASVLNRSQAPTVHGGFVPRQSTRIRSQADSPERVAVKPACDSAQSSDRMPILSAGASAVEFV